MACQLNLLAYFTDIRSVRKYLFPDNEEKKEPAAIEGWDDSDWGWKDDEAGDEVCAMETDMDHFSWLQACHVSLSPAAEMMAVAHGDRLVLLSQRWGTGNESNNIMKYSILYEGCLKQEDGEKITCLLCLPLASQKRSTQGGPDWTCVIVGFSSGYVRIYTESGTLLLSQIFSHEMVQGVKCRTYEPPSHAADAEKHEELSILYRKALVTVDGFSLVQSLRACRNQVARAAASGSEMIQPPPLAYKKWSLLDQELITDHVACGLHTPNPFDQMHTASIIGGFNATIRSTPPAAHLYVTSGSWPYAGFYYGIEGSAQPMLSDVAHAVAHKLKSALFSQISAASGWLGLGGSKQNSELLPKEKPPKIEPATPLQNRYGLHDKRRQGETIVLSPDSRLAATTDSFGRVVLLDLQRGAAVRMWKGYRDAQLGWVSVQEDTHGSERAQSGAPPRRALFLVIYAPRRGILEVWTAQHGPRVAAFNISKWCSLVCPGHGLIGLNNVTFKEVKVYMHQIYLIDPEGCVRTIEVPFHLALSDKNSRQARDMHLLKKMKIMLKENSQESASLQSDVISLILELRLSSMKQQALQRLLQTTYLSQSFLLSAVQDVHQQLVKIVSTTAETTDTEAGEEEVLDYESKTLQQFCLIQEHLLHLYSRLIQTTEAEEEADELIVDMEKFLSLSADEMSEIQQQLEKYSAVTSEQKAHIRFGMDEEQMIVSEFLGCFDCHTQRGENLPMRSKGGSPVKLLLCDELPDPLKMKLAALIFSQALTHGTSSEFNILLQDSQIPPEDIMKLLFHLWLSNNTHKMDQAIHLLYLVKSISALKEASEVTSDVNKVSLWWQKIRDCLSQSENISSSLIGALVCRGVGKEIGRIAMEAQMNNSTDSGRLDLSDWESLSFDWSAWTVLVKQLEDVLALKCLLCLTPDLVDAPCQATVIDVSVKRILDGGKGMLPEFVAKWIAGHGILPSMLCLQEEETEPAEAQDESPDADKKAMELDSPKLPPQRSISSNPIIGEIQWMQQRLPHSLDTDVLMANCTWEYLVIWSRDPEVIFPLEQALAYLRCVHNALLRHGLAAMVWQMFMVKKISAAALLIEKVGKAPKDRLCRRDVNLSDSSLTKFLGLAVEFLDTIIQASEERQEVPVLRTEDLWAGVSGPTSLVELAAEQRPTNEDLVVHHFSLAVILHAVMNFSMKAVKPLSLFDTKGRSAFFKSLQSSPSLTSHKADDVLLKARKQFMYRVISHAVQSLTELTSPSSPTPASPSSPSPSMSLLSPRNTHYARWPPILARISRDLCVDVDALRRHQVVELYSTGLDKIAEEVLLTVGDHAVMGSELMLLVGRRLAHYVFGAEESDLRVERVSKCSPSVSIWLKTMDIAPLCCKDPPLNDTAQLLSQVVNQLPEGHSEYNLAIELVDLIQALS